MSKKRTRKKKTATFSEVYSAKYIATIRLGRILILILCRVPLPQQGKGQRRVVAVHIVDAVILGGKDVRNMPYQER